MEADFADNQSVLDDLEANEVHSWRLYPKRNLEGHYKLMMMHGSTTTFTSRGLPFTEDYMYQAHIFQFDLYQRETFEQFKLWIRPLQIFKSPYDCIFIVGH
jgi:hypothetical protein